MKSREISCRRLGEALALRAAVFEASVTVRRCPKVLTKPDLRDLGGSRAVRKPLTLVTGDAVAHQHDVRPSVLAGFAGPNDHGFAFR